MDDEMMPLPKEETTPPVMNMYLVSMAYLFFSLRCSSYSANSRSPIWAKP